MLNILTFSANTCKVGSILRHKAYDKKYGSFVWLKNVTA